MLKSSLDYVFMRRIYRKKEKKAKFKGRLGMVFIADIWTPLPAPDSEYRNRIAKH